MVIVLGVAMVRDGHVEEALQLSQQHVARSRREPGCIEHGVHVDYENAQRLVFVEKWHDQAALEQHFKVSASVEFVEALQPLLVLSPEIEIFDAARVNR